MTDKTKIEMAFEKAEAAKKLLAEREKLEKWKRETTDPKYNEDIFGWLQRKKHD
jgi:hypothetical protein